MQRRQWDWGSESWQSCRSKVIRRTISTTMHVCLYYSSTCAMTPASSAKANRGHATAPRHPRLLPKNHACTHMSVRVRVRVRVQACAYLWEHACVVSYACVCMHVCVLACTVACTSVLDCKRAWWEAGLG